MINKELLVKAIYHLERTGKEAEAEEVQNLLDLAEIAIDSIHKLEQIKKIVGIEDESN